MHHANIDGRFDPIEPVHVVLNEHQIVATLQQILANCLFFCLFISSDICIWLVHISQIDEIIGVDLSLPNLYTIEQSTAI